MISTASPRERALRVLEWGLTVFKKRAALACSFGGPSGLVLVDLVQHIDTSVPVYYLDTDLLFPETYSLIERIRDRYGITPVAVKPETTLDQQAEREGDLLWASDPDRCCEIRKVQPQRAFLKRYGAWITGIRRDQSSTRSDIKHVEWDSQSGLVKIVPLADWSEGDCWEYIRQRRIPYNQLHDAGFKSIGCWPCTRAVRPGEQTRAGRWPDHGKAECGLHLAPGNPAQ